MKTKTSFFFFVEIEIQNLIGSHLGCGNYGGGGGGDKWMASDGG